jgi:hypothetical protein
MNMKRDDPSLFCMRMKFDYDEHRRNIRPFIGMLINFYS